MENDEMRWLTHSKLNEVVDRLRGKIIVTPTVWAELPSLQRLYPNTQFFFKMEHWQKSGTFKFRGALNRLLTEEPRPRGVTAASAGNHAIAVALAARELGLPAHLAMQNSANPMRVRLVRETGARVKLCDGGTATFDCANKIAQEEGFVFIHPFDGSQVTQATATIAAEMIDQADGLDAIFTSIGGGGLSGGIAAGGKLINSNILIAGVEPVGAAVMLKSFEENKAETLEKVSTIADSLGPPMTTTYCYEINRALLDHIVCVTDDDICLAMAIIASELRLAVEPASAAALAALLVHAEKFVPLLEGRRVGVVMCGSNIDASSYARHLARGIEQQAQLEGKASA